MRYITFKINNVSYIVTEIGYYNNKIVSFHFEPLENNMNFKVCYQIKDNNEFITFKQYVTRVEINSTSNCKPIDLSSIKLI